MVTVIIPTYNRANTIKRAIESVQNQTYSNLEIIIVDDNSSDNTKHIIDSINDSRIKYIKQCKNLGGAAARNVGIKNAKGSCIAFQDSDDEWLPNKLQKQLEFMESENADVVCCSYWRYMDKEKSIIPKYKIEQNINLYEKLFRENFIGTPTIIGKKQCFNSEMFDESMPRFQDWELMLRMTKRYKVAFLNEPLVNAYVQDTSITRNSKNGILAFQKIIEKNMGFFERNSEMYSYYCRRMGVLSLDFGIPQSKLFYKAYELDKNIKTAIDYLICKLKLYRLLKKIHKNN